jgi:4-carboxymuconolactone decarboxylase
MGDDVYDLGMKVRREVLGDDRVDRAIAGTNEFNAGWQDFITRTAWGMVWSRDGLDRRTRSFITLSILTALGREEEIELHVRVALSNGLSREEISEAFLHTALYAGIPVVRTAFAIAERVFAEDAPEA